MVIENKKNQQLMKLKIIQSGTRKFPVYILMAGIQEFCRTENFINAQSIVEAIGEMKFKTDSPLSIPDILQKIQDQTGVDLTTEFSRKQNFVELRFIFCKIGRDLGHDLKSIGRSIKRDHSTVIHSLKKFEDYYQTDRKFRELYESLI
jgi:chromosomal replication initiation ATPase DnaA